MLYPIITYEDGTEITASKPDKQGTVLVYVEKFDEIHDEFISATFELPGASVKSSHGFSLETMREVSKMLLDLQDDIISYAKEKEKQSA